MGDKENQELLYEKLKNSKYKQQKLPGIHVIPSMICTTAFFICTGLIFIGIGILIILNTNKIIEIEQQYDYNGKCKKGEDPKNDENECTITLQINKKMKNPIMVFYGIDNFYQNHRKFMKSKSLDQLKGKSFTLEEMEKTQDCDPVLTNKEMGKSKSIINETDKDGKMHPVELDPKELAVPCGLMAKYYFNDSFQWKYTGNEDGQLIVDDSDIALDFDKKRYANTNNKKKQWIDMTYEHFIVWMRPAGSSKFRKLWGRIYQDLEKGENVSVIVENNYDTKIFNGTKSIILTTVSGFGGKNKFLGISYIVLGGICIILAVVFFFAFKMHKKKEK